MKKLLLALALSIAIATPSSAQSLDGLPYTIIGAGGWCGDTKGQQKYAKVGERVFRNLCPNMSEVEILFVQSWSLTSTYSWFIGEHKMAGFTCDIFRVFQENKNMYKAAAVCLEALAATGNTYFQYYQIHFRLIGKKRLGTTYIEQKIGACEL